ncbi:UbiA family prenyltransferase [Natronolimnohabitans innermongolicus]|uniref:4-hydroxybenzoate polyprenyltransferase n=1 Tax=Natronolimnohabitans innermongolicus JCM 12255 TaxID=1227499 RepID=L9WZ89_9EURY|nr:UbiA family prenyltransferase [Natronolimnohabitans innermongolicus]ELY54481.1 4-hydroxybenzoate polyprenyltransferase [Natronolimnohabitans innermongolicus JCM 12255]
MERKQLLSHDGKTLAALYGALPVSLRSSTNRFRNALMYSSAYLALIAMAEVVVVSVILDLPPTPAALVVGLTVFAIYANDRLADADTDALSNPGQAAFVRRHREVLYVLASIAYGVAVALSVLGGPLALGITLLPGVCWVWYATDWIPGGGGHARRLKDVFLVNTIVVALAWAVTLTFLPLAFADAAVTGTTLFVFVYFFLRVFTNTEIPNVRDVEGDRAIGVSTLPVVFGVDRTRHILTGIDLSTAGLVIAAVSAGYLTPILAVPLLAGLTYSLGVTAFVGRYENERLLARAAECEYLVVFAALVVAVAV